MGGFSSLVGTDGTSRGATTVATTDGTGPSVGTGSGSGEPWHIAIHERYHHRAAGSGAREMERVHAKGRSRLQRTFERIVDVRTDERNWRRGAQGEEAAARRLTRLSRDWSVVHDLTIGTRGANLDHLVIGPAGVFSLNTKNLTGTVVVSARTFRHNNFRTTYLSDAVREADKVRTRVSAALGRPISVIPVIVIAGAEVEIRKQPSDVMVLTERSVVRWLESLPQNRLAPGAVITLERLARTTTTWLPARSAPASTSASRPRSPGPPPPARPATPPAPPSSDPVTVVRTGHDEVAAAAPELRLITKRWRRFGKDRIYVNDAEGTTLGWIDVPSADVEVHDIARREAVVDALLAAHNELEIAATAVR